MARASHAPPRKPTSQAHRSPTQSPAKLQSAAVLQCPSGGVGGAGGGGGCGGAPATQLEHGTPRDAWVFSQQKLGLALMNRNALQAGVLAQRVQHWSGVVAGWWLDPMSYPVNMDVTMHVQERSIVHASEDYYAQGSVCFRCAG